MPLSDREIYRRCVACADNNYHLARPPMITPFSERDKPPGKIGWGLTSAGYDIRLSGAEVWVLNPSHGETIDPKRMSDPDYRNRVFTRRTFVEGEPITVPANSFILGRSYETFNVPRDLVGTCVGRSTLARCGVVVPVTPLEPGWSGVLTIEIANVSGLPLKVYAMEGIAQIQFWKIDGAVDLDYAQKEGVYNDQDGITAARVG